MEMGWELWDRDRVVQGKLCTISEGHGVGYYCPDLGDVFGKNVTSFVKLYMHSTDHGWADSDTNAEQRYTKGDMGAGMTGRHPGMRPKMS
jgi:hypothetical protein